MRNYRGPLNLILTLVIVSLAAQQVVRSEEPTETKPRVLRHVVMFKFKPSSSRADIEQVAAAFAELPEKINAIRDFEWGTNNSTEGHDKGFTHCFLVTFADEAGRAAYLPHPAHKAFVEILRPHMADVCVVDYWSSPANEE